jgi:hypothetical protein
MNLQESNKETNIFHTPWLFTVKQTFHTSAVSDKDILTQCIYQTVSKTLAQQLFEKEDVLRKSLQNGLSLHWLDVALEHYDLEGRFDHAICQLHLTSRGPTRFSLETQFLRGTVLVTILKQEGILYFEELGL